MRKFLLFITVALLPLMCWASQAADTEYRPMLQEGKCWKYTKVIRDYFYYPTFAQGRNGEYYVTHYLKGKTTIDDKEFYNVYKHISFDTPTDIDESDAIVAYLYEDITEGKVYVTVDFESFWENTGLTDTYLCLWEEGKRDNTLLLFDFNNPDDCAVTNNCEYTGEVAFENQGIPYEGRTYSHFVTDFMIVPGLGVVCPDQDLTTGTANIFGVDYCGFTDFPCGTGLCHLYEVVDGDGKVIYYDERVAPGWTDKYIYKPMLEDGKRWKYSSVCTSKYMYPELSERLEGEILFDYVIKGKTKIGNKEYYNLYYDFDYAINEGKEPQYPTDVPFALLYEEQDFRQIFVRPNPDLEYYFNDKDIYIGSIALNDQLRQEGEVLLYDFYEPDKAFVTQYNESKGHETFENNGYQCESERFTKGSIDYITQVSDLDLGRFGIGFQSGKFFVVINYLYHQSVLVSAG